MPLTQQQTTKALNKTLRSLVPGSLQITAADRAELRQAALYEWAATEGFRRGQARATAERVEPLVTADYLTEATKPYMANALRAMGLLEDFRTRARFADEEVQQVMEEGVAPVAEAEGPDRDLPLLGQLSQGTQDDRTRAALIRMHLGQYVVPGQPKAWLNRTRYDKSLGEDVTTQGPALQDFITYHGRNATKKGQRCPTCKKIARFFRVPGAGPADIQALMDWYALKGQALVAF